jgi:hypothetical protein
MSAHLNEEITNKTIRPPLDAVGKEEGRDDSTVDPMTVVAEGSVSGNQASASDATTGNKSSTSCNSKENFLTQMDDLSSSVERKVEFEHFLTQMDGLSSTVERKVELEQEMAVANVRVPASAVPEVEFEPDLAVPNIPIPVPQVPVSSVPGAHAIAGPGLPRRVVRNQEPAPQDLPTEEEPVFHAETVEEDLGQGTPEQADQEVIDGQVVVPKRREERNVNNKCFVAAMTLLVMGGLALILGLTRPGSLGSTRSKNSNSGKDVLGGQSNVQYPPYRDDLPLDVNNAIAEIGSPGYFSNKWMVMDPNLDDYTMERQYQRFLLVYYYYRLGGDNWYRKDNWLSYKVSECLWFFQNSSLGIEGWHEGMEPVPVCDESHRLLALNLSSNNLVGPSMEWSHQVNSVIKILDLSNNKIKGPMKLDTEGKGPSTLEVFSISNNLYEGPVQGGGDISFNTRIVRINGNNMTGFNSRFCLFFSKLEVFDNQGGQYASEGYVPTEMTYCKNLTICRVGSNGYGGTIPSELGLMSKLQEFDISGSPEITGAIPTEVGLLSNLKVFDISGTGLTGPVPPGFCDRVRDRFLELRANCSAVECCQ